MSISLAHWMVLSKSHSLLQNLPIFLLLLLLINLLESTSEHHLLTHKSGHSLSLEGLKNLHNIRSLSRKSRTHYHPNLWSLVFLTCTLPTLQSLRPQPCLADVLIEKRSQTASLPNLFHLLKVQIRFHQTGNSDILEAVVVVHITTTLEHVRGHGVLPRAPPSPFRLKTKNSAERSRQIPVLRVKAKLTMWLSHLSPLVLVDPKQNHKHRLPSFLMKIGTTDQTILIPTSQGRKRIGSKLVMSLELVVHPLRRETDLGHL